MQANYERYRLAVECSLVPSFCARRVRGDVTFTVP
jgi:hypothetical protein